MKNFSNIRERIYQVIEYKCINKRKFYLETGISNGVLDKKGAYSLHTIEKIVSTYPDINLEWLLTGNGRMMENFPVTDHPNIFSGNENNHSKAMLNLTILNIELAKLNTELAQSNQKLLEMVRERKREELRTKS
jgi:hypothetical protein